MVGRYKAYPEYKNSDIKTVPDLPVDWSVSKVRFIATFGRGLGITKANLQDAGIPCVSYGEIHSKFGFEVCPSKHSLKCVDENYLLSDPYALLSKGDLVFADTSEDIEGAGNFTQLISSAPVFAGYHTVTVRPYSENNSRYLAYLFDSTDFRTQIRTAVKGVKVYSVTQAILRNANVWLPSLDEQQKIASFLDHETAKIDTLIAKQEKLIELLKEKRQAVISHAVTKGLNPDAPMKDSGVEWLGEVPEHWVVKSYRYACKIYRGKFGHRPRNDPDFYDGEYPFIQTGDVARATKYIEEYKQTLNEKGVKVSQKFPVGTLMMAIAANIGDTAILGFEAYAPDSVVGFKPKSDIDLEFLRYSFMAALPALEQTSTQSTQANLNVDRVGTVQASFPSLSEQKEVVTYLDALLERYDDIELKSKNSIELMKERRTALISAAVTGKIDVRDWQPPVQQEATKHE